MSALAGVSDAAISVRDRLRGKIGLTKVRCYRRGMVPQWATDLDDDGNDDYQRTPPATSVTNSVSISRHSAAARDHRCVRCQGHVVSAAEQEEGEPREAAATEDDEAREERRRRIRERWLLRDLEEEELLPKEDEELAPAESESDSESEHEADTEDDDTRIGNVKPVFAPKPRRETVVEKERIEEERQHFKEVARRRMELRKLESRRIIVEVIVKEEHTDKTRGEETDADIDTEDDDDGDDAWKNRELRRIKRDREARMREGEIETDNSEPLAKRKKMKNSMQRYYHKGAFFQEKADDGSQMSGTDDIYKRDFSAPTGEDKMNRSILPKVMQVKKFGRSASLKWTHLVNEDTTDLNKLYVL